MPKASPIKAHSHIFLPWKLAFFFTLNNNNNDFYSMSHVLNRIICLIKLHYKKNLNFWIQIDGVISISKFKENH